MSASPTPPRWAAALLRWAERRLSTPELSADADELFRDRVEATGRRAARRWYVRQAVAALTGVLTAGGGSGRRTRGPSPDWLETTGREVVLAGRRLRRAPLTALSYAIVVGMGVGAAAFMIQVRAAMLRPDLGLGRDVRLVSWVDSAGSAHPLASLTGAEPWLDDPHGAAGRLVPFWPASAPLSTPQGLVQASGERVRPGFLDGLGVTPFRGRDLDAPNEVVLSHRLWTARWEGDPGAVGSTLELGDRTVRIVGVAPPSFDGPMCCAPPDFWVTEYPPERPTPARLALADVTDEAMAAEWLTRVSSEATGGARADLAYAEEAPYGGETGVVGRSLAILLALSIVAWLATVLSGVNLMLADTLARGPELRLRRVLGARPAHTPLRVVAETGWLTLLAAATALASARLAVELAPWLLPMIGGTSAVEVRLGREAVAWVAGAAALTVVTCAAPVTVVALRLATRTSALRGPGSTRFASIGLGAQVALAAGVLVVTGIFVLTLRTRDGDFVGFRNGGTAVHFLLARPGTAGPTSRALVEDLAGLGPGSAVALTRRLPVYGARIDTVSLPDGTRRPAAHETVSESFFATIGSVILAGRPPRSGREVVVSEDLVREIAGAPAASLGRTLLLADTVPARIVGVVEAATWGSGRVRPTVYEGWDDEPLVRAQLLVGGGVPLATLLPALGRHGLALQPFETLDGLLLRSRILTVFLSRLASVFGGLCVLVALAGVHSHFVRWVGSRMRSLAIRSAVGAPRGRLGHDVVIAALRIVVPGAALGCAVGWLALGVVRSALGELPAAGPGLVSISGALVTATSLAALVGPVLRTTRADPLRLLREG